MPPKTKVTRDDIIDAAFELIRRYGVEALNVRALAKRLDCSTQPVMYHFATMDDLKETVYEHADLFHTQYLLNARGQKEALLEIGLNYIRFSLEEPHLFRFLFQSGQTKENDLLEMINSEELLPVLSAMKEGTGLDMEKTREVFITVAMFAHGYASILVNNDLEYDEDLISAHLENVWNGAFLYATKKERK
ncbi:MAG: TetR/AcrR family transcriptional regulator [Erysipelotrichaceae bacterium]|nr:TetR/AcrR family transcriptional regulator [Erysipelotrichaceae bacterium]